MLYTFMKKCTIRMRALTRACARRQAHKHAFVHKNTHKLNAHTRAIIYYMFTHTRPVFKLLLIQRHLVYKQISFYLLIYIDLLILISVKHTRVHNTRVHDYITTNLQHICNAHNHIYTRTHTLTRTHTYNMYANLCSHTHTLHTLVRMMYKIVLFYSY